MNIRLALSGIVVGLAATTVAVAVPAVAQDASPSAAAASPTPQATPCSTGRSFAVSPLEVDSGEAVTITVRYVTFQCSSFQERDTPVYARERGQTEYRQIGTLHTAAEQDASASLEVRPTVTTMYSLQNSGTQTDEKTVTVRGSGATPVPTQTPHRDCRAGAQVILDKDTIIATGSGGVTVREVPNTLVDLYAYTRPSTQFRLVRSATTDANGLALFTIRPPANTRLIARQRDEDCTDPVFGTEPSVVLNVRTALTLDARRNGQRDYTFSGDSLPARTGGLIVSLYRVTDSGSQVLTAQTRASATTGDWTINRKFTGTGRFGFVVRTGQDLQNAPGVSNTRSTLIY